MGVWDTSTPAGTDGLSGGDDRIREMKTALQEALRGGAAEGTEAVFPGASPSTAPIFRYRGLRGDTASRPTAAAGGLYYNTTTGTLQRSNGTTWDDLTENAAFEAIHQAVAASLASAAGVVTLPETGNSFNVTGAEAVTSFTGWSAGVFIVKWVSSRLITHNASTLILIDGANWTAAAGDISIFEHTGAAAVREISRLRPSSSTVPTRQYLTSGSSATYTTPTNCRKIIVKMLGAGGGGGAVNTNAGSAGGNTSFNSIVANGGGGGSAVSGAGAGADGTAGAGSASLRLTGSVPPPANASGIIDNSAGPNSPANSGRGGRYGVNASGGQGGYTGGCGEYAEFSISNPAASYTYTVGTGGAGGAAGTFAGGNGGSGLIVVEEYY